MSRRTARGCCRPGDNACSGGWRVEAVVAVDERGQMVLPKDLRDAAGIRAGDKLAVVTWSQGSEICCISLIRAEQLAGMVKDVLGPMVAELNAGG